jgi:hypothetical protein
MQKYGLSFGFREPYQVLGELLLIPTKEEAVGRPR